MPPCACRLCAGLPDSWTHDPGSTYKSNERPRHRHSARIFSRSAATRSSSPQPWHSRSEEALRQSRPLSSRQAWDFNHRPDLDGPLTRHGNPWGDTDRLVEMLGVDEKVAAELFARLRERTIRHEPFAVAYAAGGRHLCRGQRVGGQILPARFDLVRELRGFHVTRLPLGLAQRLLVKIKVVSLDSVDEYAQHVHARC